MIGSMHKKNIYINLTGYTEGSMLHKKIYTNLPACTKGRINICINKMYRYIQHIHKAVCEETYICVFVALNIDL